jgi:FkbM family methyltransferase
MAFSFLSNLLIGIRKRVSSFNAQIYNKELGLSFFSVKYLKHLPRDKKIRQINLSFGKVFYSSGQDLYHSLNELFEDKIYSQSLKKDSYIIDCGSNIGLSVLYLKSICPTAEIDAFEPDDNNFILLKKNVEANNALNIRLHNKAIWKENTTLNFINEASLGSRVGDSSNNENSIKVPAARLKDLLIKEVDFLKMDIEGAEYEVIMDIKDQLHFVDKLFLEYHGKFEENGQLLEMLNVVRANGFNIYIKEAGAVYKHPFNISTKTRKENLFDVQLNIFCFKDKK